MELQRLAQDAETDLAALDRQLHEEFNRKLPPVVALIAEEDHIGIVFEYPKEVIFWMARSGYIQSGRLSCTFWQELPKSETGQHR